MKIKNSTYFTVGEVAKKIGRSPQTIKRWEEIGHIPKARRLKSNGWRVFSEKQVQRILDYADMLEEPGH